MIVLDFLRAPWSLGVIMTSQVFLPLLILPCVAFRLGYPPNLSLYFVL